MVLVMDGAVGVVLTAVAQPDIRIARKISMDLLKLRCKKRFDMEYHQ